LAETIQTIIFWSGLAVPAYAYLGYPALLALLRIVLRRPVRKEAVEPPVSLLIPAFNEAEMIAQKIENSLALDYPPEKLEIVVACDGSRDATPELARRASEGTRVRVLDYPVNKGKIENLNQSVPQLAHGIVVFSDAAAMLYKDSIRKIVRNFADPQVGAVSGKYTVVKADEVHTGKSEDFYWRYETLLKVMESEIASTLGAHGHLHAIRKELYPYPPPGTINDDYIIPVSVLARGYRAVYEPEAVVYEEAREMTGFGRRVRIMAGNIQQLRELKGLLRPFQPLPALFFLSHKASRLVVPFAMMAALAANLFLLESPFYSAMLGLQAGFYLLAGLGAIWHLRPRLLLLPYYFCMINAATFVGAYHAATSRRKMAWK
jgi:cellulose synthase/poly-beta-1,6-N-acetylglucosamine synthase-like glycosyltransferase